VRIELFVKPEQPIVHQVRELEKLCQAYDHLQGSLFLDPSLNFFPDAPCLLTLFENELLVGAMTFFSPSREEAEIVGLTHPEFRRRGVFRALVTEAARQAKRQQINDFLFVCEPQSKDGVAAMHWFASEPDHTEYALRYDKTLPPDQLPTLPGLTMHRATEADLADMVRISSESFAEEADRAAHFLELALVSKTRQQYLFKLDGEPVAIGALGIEDGESTIYGLGVRTNLQNRGIGRGMVSLLVQESFAQGVEDILIEVDNTNARAHHLYLSCGFAPEAIYDYLRAPVAQFLPKEA
jgi:ribosomal protein S18 acetylase RimI-like enzyme